MRDWTNKGLHIMALESLLILLIIGAIAGFLAGLIVKGYGFGVVGNIIVGIVGAVLAAGCFPVSAYSPAATSADRSSRQQLVP